MIRSDERGYLLPSRTTVQSHLSSLKLVNSLLRLGFRVIWASEPFSARTDCFPRGHMYEPGDFLIQSTAETREVRTRDYAFVREAAAERNVVIHSLLEDCDPVGYSLTVPKIAVYRGPGTWDCYLWYTECLRSMGFAHDTFAPSEIASGKLSGYDVYAQPGGDETWQSAALWPKGRDEIRRFLENGGNYVGSCGGLDVAGDANGSALCSPNSGKIKFLNLVTYDCPRNVSRDAYPHDEWAAKYWYHIDFAEYSQLVPIALGTPVPFRVKARSPVVFGYGDTVTPGIRYSAGPIAKNLREPMRLIADFAPELLPLDSHWWAPVETAMELFNGAAAISESTFGKGRLVFFAPHPEDPNNPEHFRLVANAIFYLTAKGPARASTLRNIPAQTGDRASSKPPTQEDFLRVEQALNETRKMAEDLISSLEPVRKLTEWEYRHVPEWLLKLPGYSLILSPELGTKILEQHLADIASLIPKLKHKIATLTSQESPLAGKANSLALDICTDAPNQLRNVKQDMERMIAELNSLKPIAEATVNLRKRIEPSQSGAGSIEMWAELDAKQAELNDRLWRQVMFFLDGKAETSIYSIWREDVVGRDSKGILTGLSDIRIAVTHAVEMSDFALARAVRAEVPPVSAASG